VHEAAHRPVRAGRGGQQAEFARGEKGRKLGARNGARLQPFFCNENSSQTLEVAAGVRCALRLWLTTSYLYSMVQQGNADVSHRKPQQPLTNLFRKDLVKQIHNGSSCTLSALLDFPSAITAPEHPLY